MALTSSGLLFAWGLNVYGQLGIGDFQDSDVPIHVDSLSHSVIK